MSRAGKRLSAMSQPVEGVIFDLGGVLIDWNPLFLYRKIFAGDETKAADFLARVCTPEWNEKQDAGRDLEEAAADRIALFPQWEPEIRAFYGRWTEMIGGLVPGTGEVMRALNTAGVRLFALSNWNSNTFARIRSRYAELDRFEHIVLSGDHGCTKPGERLYRIALERYGLPPERLLFIDDNPANIAAGERLGIRGLQFSSAGELHADLVELGLLQPRA
jgi:2-haloacid dehalogenase